MKTLKAKFKKTEVRACHVLSMLGFLCLTINPSHYVSKTVLYTV